MKNRSLKILLVVLFICGSYTTISAQYSSIDVGKKQKTYRDSLKNTKYDYMFPILGQKAYEKGFDIPYPAGIMANYIWIKQNIIIDNMQLGFNGENIDIPLTPIDFIEFGENVSTVNSYNFRPDLWVFPFLNVYGLFGGGTSRTEVNLVAPIKLQSIVEQNVSTKGVGIMGAGGVGKYWFSVDGNWTWSKPELLDESVKVSVLGLRWGRSFNFKNNPESNLAFWIGMMRTELDTKTSGQLKLNEALPPEFWDRKDEAVADYEAWKVENYDDLNFAQKKAVDEVLDPIISAIDSRNGEAIVKYGMDKQVEQLWNGVVGAQYQFNKKWQFRTEAGLIGNRKSFMLSLNYRFLL